MDRELIPICVRGDSKYDYLEDHKVDGRILIPPSLFIVRVDSIYVLTVRLMSERNGNSEAIFIPLRSSWLGKCTCPNARKTNMILAPLFWNTWDCTMISLWVCTVSKTPSSQLADPSYWHGMQYNDIVITISSDTKYASVMIFRGSGNFQVTLQDSDAGDDFRVVLTGNIRSTSSESIAAQLLLPIRIITKTQYHKNLEHAGYNLGEEFSLVERITCENKSKYASFYGALHFTILCSVLMCKIFPYRIRRRNFVEWELGRVLGCAHQSSDVCG